MKRMLPADDTKGCECIPMATPATSDAFACPADGRITQAESLAGVRLGKHERRVLLAAPEPVAEPAIVEPERPGRVADEANRRAIRRLAELGLVVLADVRQDRQYGRDPISGRRVRLKPATWRRAIRLTALGALVVERLRPYLEAGKPFRWAGLLPELVASVRLPAGELGALHESTLEADQATTATSRPRKPAGPSGRRFSANVTGRVVRPGPKAR